MCDPTKEKEQAFQQAKQYRINELERKLASAELSNKQLREALEAYESAKAYARQYVHLAEASEQIAAAFEDAEAKMQTALAQPISTEALDAYVAKLIPPGWKVVPVEPTLDMGWAYLNAAQDDSPEARQTFNHSGYRAAIEAAPLPPAPEKG